MWITSPGCNLRTAELDCGVWGVFDGVLCVGDSGRFLRGSVGKLLVGEEVGSLLERR